MSTDKKFKIMVAAGGTGGHLFPAIAVLEQIEKITNGKFEAYFVGNAHRIEGRVVPAKGFKLLDLPISGFPGLFSTKIFSLPFKILKSKSMCRKLIREFRPDALLCAGAYISYPAASAAYSEKVPVYLMESNVIPGKTISMLAKKAKTIFTAFPESEKYFPDKLKERLSCVGNPVRRDILSLPSREASLSKLGLSPEKRTLLVFGGSLGARSINNAVLRAIETAEKDRVQFIWQTGKNFRYDGSQENVSAMEFIDDMATAYSAADLVVSRAGATSISEICVTGKPSVLVPYPFAANNHQALNAIVMEENGASVFAADDKIGALLPEIVDSLLFDSDKLRAMSASALAMAKPDAAEKIASRVVSIEIY